MTLEADCAAAARDLLAHHLVTNGLSAKVAGDGVRTGIGRVVVDFDIEKIEATGGHVQMGLWARIDGVDGLSPPRIDLDLLGLGETAHEALQSAFTR